MPKQRPQQLPREIPSIGVGTLNVSERAKELVMSVLSDNRLSYGRMQQRFESDFARLHGCRFGVMSNSGTSALHIALSTLKCLHGWQDGDEVIVPAVTFVATVNVVLHNNLRPVFVDVEREYYEIDASRIEAAITPRTRALIPVHLFGLPCDMDPIVEIAKKHGLRTIEDSCETMFANCRGRSVGSLSDIACFSTYVAHLIVTGVGGLNTTNNPDYAVTLRQLLNHGRDSIYISIDDDDDVSEERLKMIIARRFAFTHVGHSFRVTEMEAALGVAQLEGWEQMIARRRANAAFLNRALAVFQDRLQLPKTREGCDHSFMMYPIVLRDQPKEELVQYLETQGVETRDMLPLTNQPVYKRLLGIREEDFPAARWINQNGFYVGCHQDLTQLELEYIVELFERYWRQRGKKSLGEEATLILWLEEQPGPLGEILEEIPYEMFAQVLAFHGESGDQHLELLRTKGIQTLPTDGRNLVQALADDGSGVGHDKIVVFPLDGRHDVRDIARLLLALERGNDMVIASRFIVGGERRSFSRPGRYRSIGNRVFNLLASLLFLGNISDGFSQFRAFRRSKVGTPPLTSAGLPLFFQLSIRAMRQGWRVVEIPTTEFVNPQFHTARRIALSIIPVLKVLLGEWIDQRRT